MTGRITLMGAGELMSTMSPIHRLILSSLNGPPRPVFLDTTAAYETNIDTIVAKAVEYYAHHLQTELRHARYRHRERDTASEVAGAIAEIRACNLVFAGPGSPSYALKQWRESPVWDALEQQFEAGAEVFFASAASITLGRYALPVYEIYKAGNDPFWLDGLDLLGKIGLNLAIVPHYNDNSGGENYDTRFCYMGAGRFDLLQERLPPDVAILGLDAYTAIRFDPRTETALVSGQGGVTLIGGGAEQRFEAGANVPFDTFRTSSREFVRTFDPAQVYAGYEFSDDPAEAAEDPAAGVRDLVESLTSIKESEKVEVLARLETLRQAAAARPSSTEAPLVDLVLELRSALRAAKRFDLADKARTTLDELGFEVGDTAEGATWTRR